MGKQKSVKKSIQRTLHYISSKTYLWNLISFLLSKQNNIQYVSFSFMSRINWKLNQCLTGSRGERIETSDIINNILYFFLNSSPDRISHIIRQDGKDTKAGECTGHGVMLKKGRSREKLANTRQDEEIYLLKLINHYAQG